MPKAWQQKKVISICLWTVVCTASLAFSDNYHFDKFKSIVGTLEIIGLSPWNDFHIFESINAAALSMCTYYFFNENECDVVKSLLPTLSGQGKIRFKSVKEFWEKYYEE